MHEAVCSNMQEAICIHMQEIVLIKMREAISTDMQEVIRTMYAIICYDVQEVIWGSTVILNRLHPII